MCVVSMVGDYFGKQWEPFVFPKPGEAPVPMPMPTSPPQPLVGGGPIIIIPAEEFEAVKREVQHMKELLKKAKIYDEQTNQPDCQKEEKIQILRKMAEHFGISLDEVLGKEKT